ncbi:NADH dehydrogenase I subunit K [Escherichia coli]|uniref:NADH dehydrogenase I subunit K n=1 Tax=Escherichia coli TaxID=562 RepID=A0A377DF00_ECOLX|nr:NADH dehydrogenase I subunit K [Escherichia coli]
MIPLQHGLILAAILFVLGLTGLVIRRNLLFMLIGLEIMINASALAFVVAGSYWGQTDGQVMYILAISLARQKRVSALRCCCNFTVVART